MEYAPQAFSRWSPKGLPQSVSQEMKDLNAKGGPLNQSPHLLTCKGRGISQEHLL